MKFHHVRITDKQNRISPNGGACVAYQVNPNTGLVEYATARCNPHDNYNKAYGRAKASGRLKSQQYKHYFNGNESEFIKYYENYYQTIS